MKEMQGRQIIMGSFPLLDSARLHHRLATSCVRPRRHRAASCCSLFCFVLCSSWCCVGYLLYPQWPQTFRRRDKRVDYCSLYFTPTLRADTVHSSPVSFSRHCRYWWVGHEVMLELDIINCVFSSHSAIKW